MTPTRRPRLTNRQSFAVDRCQLQVLRVLTNLDIVDPKERACVLAAVALRIEEARDREASLAISLGDYGAQAAIARAMGVSRQAVSKRFRHAREQRRAGAGQASSQREP